MIDASRRRRRISTGPSGAATMLGLAFVLLAGCGADDGSPSAGVDYNWDIRPILSENCFRCHGPDADSRKADLRLDLRAAATGELPKSPDRYAIVPGRPEQSELIRRVTSDDVDVVMPPPGTHLTLTAAQVDLLERWIDAGAEYKDHWAFITPQRPAEPRSAFDAGAVNAIDRFVRARLEAEGLAPSSEADKETLINRVALSLTGLPPSPDEVAAFVADARPDAYERLVDRLLASPAYGERMATDWLDAARFADSDGYLDDDFQRLLHPWRDWVIDAFNRNLPYDEFGSWQLAGDLYDDATREQRIATMFGRLHRRNAENGIIDEEYRVEYVIDRTDTVGTAMLGLSVGCARCHDHKFDPISHVDYYSLAAFFNSTDDAGFYPQEKWATGPTMYLTDAATDARIAELERAIVAREAEHAAALERARARLGGRAAELAGSTAALGETLERAIAAAETAHFPFDATREDPARAASYEGNPGLAPSEPLVFSPSATPGLAAAVLQAPILGAGVRGQALYFDDDNTGFIDKADKVGWFDHPDAFSIDLWVYAARVYDEAAILNHNDHLRYGSGGWSVDLEDNRVRISLVHAYPREQIVVVSEDALAGEDWTHVAFTYDGSARAAGVTLYLDGVAVPVEVRRDRLTESMLPLGLPFAFDTFNGLAFGKRWQQAPLVDGAIDELRVFDRALGPLEVAYLHEDGAASAGNLVAEVTAELAALDAEVVAARDALGSARAELNTLLTGLEAVMVMGDTDHPRQTYVLERGVYSNHGEPVYPRGLEQIFPYPDDLPQNRLGLAEWLFDPDHPLTARVYANRLWQLHFGTGLVATAEEFGSQGALPSHPALLDWLAREFVESGWDVKALNKIIVMSATFRQSSVPSDEMLERDPTNVLLARGVSRRLSAEQIRDAALAASGLLDTTVGGPSVFPYQPPGVWEAFDFYGRSRQYPDPEDAPEDQHRRSLYSMVRRGAPVPSMTIFDFPRRHTSQVRRPLSSTPLQALVLLNDPQYVEASRALAERALLAHDETDARLAQVFKLGARRSPEAAELAVLREFYAAELAAFTDSPDNAAAYLDIGIAPVAGGVDPAELAALASTANVVLNTPDAYMQR